MRRFLLFLSLHSSWLSFAQKTQQPDYTPLIEKYRSIFARDMEQYHDAGMSIALVDGDSVVWCEGFGYFNKADRQQVSGHTPFHIGSVCKVFTGIAVMQLQEKGKLNIDRPFARYVPAFRLQSRYGRARNITTRMILSHHAGIPDFVKDKMMPVHPYFTGVLDYVNDDYATFPPNTIYSYSNAGFSILGNLVENVAGVDYYSYIQKHILDPLGMMETGFVRDTLMPLSVRLGYNARGDERREDPLYDAPAGCIYSTANDMAQFIKAHIRWGALGDKRILDSVTIVKMMEDQSSRVARDFGKQYGLAWNIYYNDGGKSIQHDGGMLYHRTELSISPYAGLGVVILSNSASGKPLRYTDYDILNEAVRIKGLTPQPIPPVHKNTLNPAHNLGDDQKTTSHPRRVTRDQLLRYEGSYGTFGTYCKITADSNCLVYTTVGQKFFMLPVEQDLFAGSLTRDTTSLHPTNWYYFEKTGDQEILVQVDHSGYHYIMGEKMEPVLLDTTWKKRLGKYAADGKSTRQMLSGFELRYSDNTLFLSAKFNMDTGIPTTIFIPLKIVNDHLACVYGLGRLSGQHVQFKRIDGREVMKFMGFNCTLNK